MYIKEDKIEEVINLLKEKEFKEDGKFLVFEDGKNYFAYNKETKDFSYVGSDDRDIDYYIEKFNLKKYLKNEGEMR